MLGMELSKNTIVRYMRDSALWTAKRCLRKKGYIMVKATHTEELTVSWGIPERLRYNDVDISDLRLRRNT